MDRRATFDAIRATSTTTDLLVSFPGKQFSRARHEILRLLEAFGDTGAWVEKTDVWGIAVVHASLNNRDVIQRCHALWNSAPNRFRFAIKWLPVDYWCGTSLAEIAQVLDQHIVGRLGEDATWAMRVQKRRWQRYPTPEIVRELATRIPRKVNLSHPDWIVWIDVVGRSTAVSLLRPEEIFAPLAREAAPLP